MGLQHGLDIVLVDR